MEFDAWRYFVGSLGSNIQEGIEIEHILLVQIGIFVLYE